MTVIVKPVGLLAVAALSSAPRPLSTHTRDLAPAQRVRDVEIGGRGRVWGYTKIKNTSGNVPTRARVVLMLQRGKMPVRETWSDPSTGYFEFIGIDTQQQFVTYAEDAAGNFLPVAASKLTPEVP